MSLFKPLSYQKNNEIIERIDPLEVSPHHKQILLKECLAFFTGGELPSLDDFKFIGEDENEEGMRCLCSQTINKVYIIEYIPKGIKFKLGRNCFEKLYGRFETNENDFFKPFCLNCKDNKVLSRRSKEGKLGLCSKKCMHIFNKKVNCAECGLKFWKMSKHHKLCKKCYFNTFFSTLDIGGNRIYL
tara:strand:+ start:266 stop:823 length:558 start_codon:yes stop_codon:yes gene_type:complete